MAYFDAIQRSQITSVRDALSDIQIFVAVFLYREADMFGSQTCSASVLVISSRSITKEWQLVVRRLLGFDEETGRSSEFLESQRTLRIHNMWWSWP